MQNSDYISPQGKNPPSFKQPDRLFKKSLNYKSDVSTQLGQKSKFSKQRIQKSDIPMQKFPEILFSTPSPLQEPLDYFGLSFNPGCKKVYNMAIRMS